MYSAEPPYTLFVSDHCTDCVSVVEFIQNNAFPCELKNIDRENEKPEISIFIIPALVKGQKLLAYGEKDILKILKKTA